MQRDMATSLGSSHGYDKQKVHESRIATGCERYSRKAFNPLEMLDKLRARFTDLDNPYVIAFDIKPL